MFHEILLAVGCRKKFVILLKAKLLTPIMNMWEYERF